MSNCVTIHPDKLRHVLSVCRDKDLTHLVASNRDHGGNWLGKGDIWDDGGRMPDDVWVSKIVDAAAAERWRVVTVWSMDLTTYVLLQPVQNGVTE